MAAAAAERNAAAATTSGINGPADRANEVLCRREEARPLVLIDKVRATTPGAAVVVAEEKEEEEEEKDDEKNEVLVAVEAGRAAQTDGRRLERTTVGGRVGGGHGAALPINPVGRSAE